MLLAEGDIVVDDVWDLGCLILVHVNVLGKASNGFLKLCVALRWLGEKLDRLCWFDTRASSDIDG